MSKGQLITVGIILILFIPFLCYSAGSDLKKMVDSQGNIYAVDEKGILYTDGIPHLDRQAASVENIAYYFNQSGSLEAHGYLEEAMKMYHEIMCLPDVNQVKMAKYAINLRLKLLYNNNTTRDLVLKYFDVKGSGNDLEIIPRGK